ncbi:MAG: response regulator transcription factor [Proteobacteria bacterium]|jgi:two-component system LytT family response regulator|nr:DNA-binding response regulator [Methylibium sp.]MBY0367243.1 LytTR family DNA-binding domain-containing protein [Burkholderiaceae bacterium]MCH8855941.1 response regulator transcription factor [Pseudomonadota bacterium]|mmetsp:Transcript_53148/g.124462  ORF Transcript_53148/g.124462 Transcript_53148/m.124462 type:complete len:239 (+) Transcript_53148:1085-1801(+)
MKIFIVEDSRLARQELRTLLAAVPDADIVGEAAELAAAREAIEQLQPELLLLDVELPGATGFDLLDQLEHLPLVVFTTAYDQHALAAFERNALDYLLKPIDPERLEAALAKARERLHPVPAAAAGGTKGVDDMVFLRDGERCWFVRLGDIAGFESCGNYAQAWFDGQRPLIHRTLTALEEKLDPQVFFRASRSHLINLRWVQGIEPWSNEGYRVTLRSGHRVEVSRRQAKLLRERLEL